MGRGPRMRHRLEVAAAAAASNAGSTLATVEHSASPAAEQQVSEQATRRKRRRVSAASDPLPEPRPEQIEAWADDTPRQSRWLQSRGGAFGERLEEAAGGLLQFRDFMPLEIAECVLSVLEKLPESVWELSEQGGDSGAAEHRFWSADICDVPELAPLRGVFWRMLPSFRGEPTLPIFSCGRYGASDFIGRHDDRAHVPFFGAGTIYSRTVAAIWYLTRDWSEEDGGSLIDLQAEGEPRRVPTFNSLTVFEVPHWHAVSAVKSQRYRYSIFGWWHQAGQRYELPGEEGGGSYKGSKRRKKKPVGEKQ